MSGMSDTQLLWSGIGVAVLVGIVWGVVEWKVDAWADRRQRALLPLRDALARYGCGEWVTGLLDAAIVGDVAEGLSLARMALKTRDPVGFFHTELAAPIHDYYERWLAESGGKGAGTGTASAPAKKGV